MCNIFVEPHVDFFEYIFKVCMWYPWHLNPERVINVFRMTGFKENINKHQIPAGLENMTTGNHTPPTPRITLTMYYRYLDSRIR